MQRIILATGAAILALTLTATTSAARELPEPPGARMSVDGAPAIMGTLGSYCYFEAGGGGCGDIGEELVLDEWLFSGGEELTFRLSDDARFGPWVIEYSRYPDGPVVTRLDGSQAGREEVSVQGPPAGDWRISFRTELTTGSGEGDAIYEWRLSAMPDTATGSSAGGVSGWVVWFAIPGAFLAAVATLGLYLPRRRRVAVQEDGGG